MMHRRNFLLSSAGAAASLRLSWAWAGDKPPADAYAIELAGLRVRLATPRIVAERAEGYCWYPDLLQFSTGELMLNHSLNADTNENGHNSQAVCLSDDSGQTFSFAYDVNGFHNGGGEPRVALPDGRIVGTSTFLKPDPPGQWRRFAAHYWTYDRGGKRYAVEPWAVRVEGLPREVTPYAKPSRTWWARINWFSDLLILEPDRWIATLSLHFEQDKRATTVAIASADEGRSWRYLSTIAGPDAVADASEGFDEPCLIQLEDGDVMCVSRVGAGANQKLARAYSSDGGKSWSALDRLPAWSVAPQMCRLANGVLALTTGRPGIFLWLASDRRGKEWQSIDLVDWHNKAVEERWRMDGTNQTTAYTALLEISPDRLFIVYDRPPFGWRSVAADSGERSQIYLVEAWVERS